jgi:hypothetical protein
MNREQEELMEVYARLKALNENLPNRPNRLLEPRYIEDFHSLVRLLQSHSSADLSRFKVPLTAISVKAGSEGTAVDLEGSDWYDLHFVKAKIEGLLKFFELQWSEPKPRIGFRPQ